MELDKALLQLFPNINLFSDCELRDDGDGKGAYIWAWHRPEPQPARAELEAAWETWQAGEPARAARQAEIKQAPITARQFFAASPAALAFIRLTPAEQATQIDGMTLAQLKTVVKFLAVAVSAIIKRDYINGG